MFEVEVVKERHLTPEVSCVALIVTLHISGYALIGGMQLISFQAWELGGKLTHFFAFLIETAFRG
jgi:hypothetical protein